MKTMLVLGVLLLSFTAQGRADVTNIPQCEVHCGPALDKPTRCRSSAMDEVGPTGNKGFCLDECTGFLDLSADSFTCENECAPTEECHVGVRATASGPACTTLCFTPQPDPSAELDDRPRRHRGERLGR